MISPRRFRFEWKPLAGGDVRLHTIPDKGQWTIYFLEEFDFLGSFSYDQKEGTRCESR